jgi:hypothetical protein
MNRNLTRSTVVLGVSALLLAVAHAASSLPAVQHSGKIEYMNGGIGKDESTALQSEGRHWPLALEFAVKDKQRAEFAANVQVAIRDASQHTDLQVNAAGPILLARLAPGNYVVEAKLDGKMLTRKVQVVDKHPAKVEFLWPAGT